ncbi:hypothetical protein JCM11641_007448, partial [Rhodosporidiobolus odoratus]
MDALSPSFFQLPALPCMTPSSPSQASTSSRTSKRTTPPEDEEAVVQPPTKRRAPRSTAAEKAAKKTARMERNRIAAQVSRDRKKNQAQYLETRVAELEAQLAISTSSVLVPSTAPPADDSASAQLKEENEALKTQLSLEKRQSQALQIRLSALESKFGRLEQLLSSASPGVASLGTQATALVEIKQEKPEESKESTSMMETDSSRLVAREVESSLQRKLSHPSSARRHSTFLPTSSLSTSPSPPSTLPLSGPTLHQILSSIKVPSLPPL